MNGVLNVIAALVLGGGVVWAGHSISQSQSAGAMSEAEAEAFKERTIQEVKAEMAGSCGECCDELTDLKAMCSAGDRLGGLEEPYTSTATARGGSTSTATPTTTSSQSYEAPVKTAVLGASVDGTENNTVKWQEGQGKLVDKKDNSPYFDENTRLSSSSTATQKPVDKPDNSPYFDETTRLSSSSTTQQPLVDKPDTSPYFTENKRIDGKPIDKYDDSPYFDENTRLTQVDPCLNPDGTPYTGPGTAQDPFADTNECYAGVEDYEIAEIDDPCVIDPVTGEAKGSRFDPVTGEDPCLTDQRFAVDIPQQDPCLNPDGTVYTGPGTAQDPYAATNECNFGVEPYEFAESTDPCAEGVANSTSDGYALLESGDPCVTDTREGEVVVAEVPNEVVNVPNEVYFPETPVQPETTPPSSEPVRTAWTSPYQSIPTGWSFGPQPTIPRGGSDYSMQSVE